MHPIPTVIIAAASLFAAATAPAQAVQPGTFVGTTLHDTTPRGNPSFTVTLEGVTKRALLIIGVTKNKTPFDMNVDGARGCLLYQSLDIVILYTQWLVADSVNAFGVVASDRRQLDVR
ncbi:MAG: hypothetical protein V3U11_07925 [Planctomycetota bacterium]